MTQMQVCSMADHHLPRTGHHIQRTQANKHSNLLEAPHPTLCTRGARKLVALHPATDRRTFGRAAVAALTAAVLWTALDEGSNAADDGDAAGVCEGASS